MRIRGSVGSLLASQCAKGSHPDRGILLPPNRPDLDCGDVSPLSDWETCLPVPKRGHAHALHMAVPPVSQAVPPITRHRPQFATGCPQFPNDHPHFPDDVPQGKSHFPHFTEGRPQFPDHFPQFFRGSPQFPEGFPQFPGSVPPFFARHTHLQYSVPQPFSHVFSKKSQTAQSSRLFPICDFGDFGDFSRPISRSQTDNSKLNTQNESNYES